MTLVAQKFTQTVASSVFPADFTAAALGFYECAPSKIKVLTIVCTVLFLNWFGPALAALVSYGYVKLDAVAAAAQVGFAFLTYIAPARCRAQVPFPPTVEAMPRHAVNLIARVTRDKYSESETESRKALGH